MQAASLRDSVLVMRAAAAYSTALKNTSDMLRHTLRTDRIENTDADELPELVIKELTADQVVKIRESQKQADEPRSELDLAGFD